METSIQAASLSLVGEKRATVRQELLGQLRSRLVGLLRTPCNVVLERSTLTTVLRDVLHHAHLEVTDVCKKGQDPSASKNVRRIQKLIVELTGILSIIVHIDGGGAVSSKIKDTAVRFVSLMTVKCTDTSSEQRALLPLKLSTDGERRAGPFFQEFGKILLDPLMENIRFRQSLPQQTWATLIQAVAGCFLHLASPSYGEDLENMELGTPLANGKPSGRGVWIVDAKRSPAFGKVGIRLFSRLVSLGTSSMLNECAATLLPFLRFMLENFAENYPKEAHMLIQATTHVLEAVSHYQPVLMHRFCVEMHPFVVMFTNGRHSGSRYQLFQYLKLVFPYCYTQNTPFADISTTHRLTELYFAFTKDLNFDSIVADPLLNLCNKDMFSLEARTGDGCAYAEDLFIQCVAALEGSPVTEYTSVLDVLTEIFANALVSSNTHADNNKKHFIGEYEKSDGFKRTSLIEASVRKRRKILSLNEESLDHIASLLAAIPRRQESTIIALQMTARLAFREDIIGPTVMTRLLEIITVFIRLADTGTLYTWSMLAAAALLGRFERTQDESHLIQPLWDMATRRSRNEACSEESFHLLTTIMERRLLPLSAMTDNLRDQWHLLKMRGPLAQFGLCALRFLSTLLALCPISTDLCTPPAQCMDQAKLILELIIPSDPLVAVSVGHWDRMLHNPAWFSAVCEVLLLQDGNVSRPSITLTHGRLPATSYDDQRIAACRRENQSFLGISSLDRHAPITYPFPNRPGYDTRQQLLVLIEKHVQASIESALQDIHLSDALPNNKLQAIFNFAISFSSHLEREVCEELPLSLLRCLRKSVQDCCLPLEKLHVQALLSLLTDDRYDLVEVLTDVLWSPALKVACTTRRWPIWAGELFIELAKNLDRTARQAISDELSLPVGQTAESDHSLARVIMNTPSSILDECMPGICSNSLSVEFLKALAYLHLLLINLCETSEPIIERLEGVMADYVGSFTGNAAICPLLLVLVPWLVALERLGHILSASCCRTICNHLADALLSESMQRNSHGQALVVRTLALTSKSIWNYISVNHESGPDMQSHLERFISWLLRLYPKTSMSLPLSLASAELFSRTLGVDAGAGVSLFGGLTSSDVEGILQESSSISVTLLLGRYKADGLVNGRAPSTFVGVLCKAHLLAAAHKSTPVWTEISYLLSSLSALTVVEQRLLRYTIMKCVQLHELLPPTLQIYLRSPHNPITSFPVVIFGHNTVKSLFLEHKRQIAPLIVIAGRLAEFSTAIGAKLVSEAVRAHSMLILSSCICNSVGRGDLNEGAILDCMDPHVVRLTLQHRLHTDTDEILQNILMWRDEAFDYNREIASSGHLRTVFDILASSFVVCGDFLWTDVVIFYDALLRVSSLAQKSLSEYLSVPRLFRLICASEDALHRGTIPQKFAIVGRVIVLLVVAGEHKRDNLACVRSIIYLEGALFDADCVTFVAQILNEVFGRSQPLKISQAATTVISRLICAIVTCDLPEDRAQTLLCKIFDLPKDDELQSQLAALPTFPSESWLAKYNTFSQNARVAVNHQGDLDRICTGINRSYRGSYYYLLELKIRLLKDKDLSGPQMRLVLKTLTFPPPTTTSNISEKISELRAECLAILPMLYDLKSLHVCLPSLSFSIQYLPLQDRMECILTTLHCKMFDDHAAVADAAAKVIGLVHETEMVHLRNRKLQDALVTFATKLTSVDMHLPSHGEVNDTFLSDIPFEAWMTSTCAYLLSKCHSSSLRALYFFAQVDARFCEQIFPATLYLVIVRDISLALTLWANINAILAEPLKCKRRTRVILTALVAIRQHSLSIDSEADEDIIWSNVDMHQMLKAAYSTQEYALSMLILDIAKTRANNPFGLLESKLIQNIIHTATEELGDSDAYHALGQPTDEESLAIYYQHEHKWAQALFLAESNLPSKPMPAVAMNALRWLNLPQMIRGSLSSETAGELIPLHIQDETTWKNSLWSTDHVHRDSNVAKTFDRTLYVSLQHLRDRSLEAIRTETFVPFVSLLADGSVPHTVLRSSLLDLHVLRHVRTAAASGSVITLANTLETSVVRLCRRQPLEQVERVASVQTSILKCLSNVHLGLEELLAKHLLFCAKQARKAGHFGKCHGPLAELKKLMESPKLQGLSWSCFWTLERCKLLWATNEKVAASNMLRTFCNRIQEKKDYEPTHPNAAHFARLLCKSGEWLASLKCERTDIIMQQYLSRAEKIAITACRADSTNPQISIPKICGRIYYALASHSDDQYQEFQRSVDDDVLQQICMRREADIERCNSLLPKATQLEQRNLSTHIASLQAAVRFDRGEIARLIKMRDVALIKAIENYILCLYYSDNFNICAFRTCSLWMENCELPIANEAMKKYLDKLQSRKFLPLIYQMAARLSTPNSGVRSSFQDVLAALMKKMTLDHPFHTLYPLLALQNGDKDRKMKSHLAKTTIDEGKKMAAHILIKELRATEKLRKVIDETQTVCDAYIQAAFLPLPPPQDLLAKTTTTRSRKPQAKTDITFDKNVQLLRLRDLSHVPITTSTLPVDPSCNYKSVDYISSFDATYKTVGGK